MPHRIGGNFFPLVLIDCSNCDFVSFMTLEKAEKHKLKTETFFYEEEEGNGVQRTKKSLGLVLSEEALGDMI